MRQAALPHYITKDQSNPFRDCPSGHRFSLYFQYWSDQFHERDREKTDAAKEACAMPTQAKELLTNLRDRQAALAMDYPQNQLLNIEAKSIAPFTTGLGNEHPIENGFAFLNPYGLPYLAASGIKGVVRLAAEELALFPGEFSEGDEEKTALDLLDVWALFGFEGELLTKPKEGKEDQWYQAALSHLAEKLEWDRLLDFIETHLKPSDESRPTNPEEAIRLLQDQRRNIHTQGALTFWDCLPNAQGGLTVEIMTPHYGDYYQGNDSPHDSGSPTPIPFLAIPEGTEFSFFITCQTGRLPAPLQKDWQDKLRAIYKHAFDWCGFGAKTAVGYGAMERSAEMEDQRCKAEKVRQEHNAEAAQRAIEEREQKAQLEADVKDLAEDAKALVKRMREENWVGDNNRLLAEAEHYLENSDSLSQDAIDALKELIEDAWPGITKNPEATQGKKKKPKYKDRPKALAIRLQLALEHRRP